MMTEEQWLTCTDPRSMLRFLRGKVSDRKARLFSCGCCRRAWNVLRDESQRALRVAESYADGQASEDELGIAADLALAAYGEAAVRTVIETEAALAVWRACKPGRDVTVAFAPLRLVAYAVDESNGGIKTETTVQSALLRDIVGPLSFRSVTLSPLLLTPTIVQLAQGIYSDRAWDRLPVLGDALEEAGCNNQDMLMHCRSGDGHTRGCWVVDLVLGKS